MIPALQQLYAHGTTIGKEQMGAMHGESRSILVVGLGRFGTAAARTLGELGEDVLAVDKDPMIVARWSGNVPVMEADLTDPLAVEQINASHFDAALVAIGDSVEASILATGNLLDAGIPDVWAKSVSHQHTRILQRIGASHVFRPETDGGKRVGHLLASRFLDYIEIEGPYSVVKVLTPSSVCGQSIANAQIRERFGVSVIGVKNPGEEFQYGSTDIVIRHNAELIILGAQKQIDRFIES